MSNPFSGIITSDFKDMHKNLIDALFEDDALVQPFKFVYTGSKYEQCPNCVWDTIGNKSSNVFLDGGPHPFINGQMCPMCMGEGTKIVSSEETVYMMAIWDSKGWIPMPSNAVRTPDLALQTQCKTDIVNKILRVSYIEVTDIEGFGTQRFVRHGDPGFVGLNNNNWALVMWKKVS